MISLRSKLKVGVLSIVSLGFLISCQQLDNAEITGEEIIAHINYLASEELEGRFPGTTGDSLAAAYIRERFTLNGLELLGEDGYQAIEVNTQVELGDSNSLTWNRRNFLPESEFVPVSFSGNGTVSGLVVFAGFGIQVSNAVLQHDDYAGLSVDGKVVMVLEGGPKVDEGQEDPYAGFVSERFKVLTAKDRGAVAVIFVAGEQFDADDQIRFTNRKEPSIGIPVIRLKRESADLLLSASAQTVNELEQQSSAGQSLAFETSESITLQTDLAVKAAHTQNIAGLLKSPGYPNDSIIVVGAHYDHLGFGGKGTGSRVPDTLAVHYGADDNASGVAGVIELAGKLNAVKKELKHTYVFIAFAAEELGLIGSKYFAENPLVSMDQVRAMVNLDMIGRLNEERRVSVGGVGTAAEFAELLGSNNAFDFSLGFSQEGYGPSDHASFYSLDIPVLFVSTGAHVDYHTPDDSADRINVEGTTEVVQQVFDWVMLLDQLPAISYREAGPKQQTAGRHSYKVTLGIMPDVSGQSNEGLKIEFATEGRPAHRAGLQKGDIIKAMDGHAVGNIYDYMARLQNFEAGQTISVEVQRGEEILVFLVQL